MKAKFMCFKLSKTIIGLILIIILQLIFIAIGIKEVREQKSFEEIKEHINYVPNSVTEERKEKIGNKTENEESKNSSTNEESKQIIKQKEEYKDMPQQVKGYKVIGKITIPKVKLDTYILEETNKKSLKVSVTKLCGPGINQVGNFCIAGHNYRNNKMFGGIKKLEKGDKIILTDTYSNSITYEVYENYQISPKDVSSLNQETGGEREVTLITCTARSN